MTELTKPVKRALMSRDRKGRQLIVELTPGDMLTFRSKGKRRTVSVYLGHCLNLAQILTSSEEYKAKLEEYTAKKKAGAQFLRKPKKPMMPFDRVYFEALK